MLKAIGYFAIGLFAGLTVAELMKDAKPIEKITIYDGYIVRYDYPHYYRYNPYQYNQLYPYGYYNYNVNTYSRGNNSGRQRSTGENKSSNTGTKSFDHTPQERTDSWGKKN